MPGRLPQLNATTSPQQAYKTTLARLDKIQSHLTKAPPTPRLKGKVCIITGVGSLKGIGRATALAYAHSGAQHLYLLDFAGENLPNLKETIEKAFPDVKTTVVQGDAADEATISGLCKRALQEEGRLDVFFANAGVASRTPLHQITPEAWETMMRINTLSVFLAVKHASLAMLKVNASAGKEDTAGSIILTASVAGLRSGAGPIDYSASKAAVVSVAQTSAHQLARTNVRVNALCPGLIETGMTSVVFDAARARGTASKIGQLNPLGRHGVAEEIAQVALFLGSDESSYINGQAIPVDGGLSASHPVIPGKIA
ncbi:sex determination protein tasselseed-2 [Hysterangium stoloniferum]|nr:sex determination protein tasselseed-2 [Hysterangium stoloniferum]